jgi:mRNA interferase RelE/StbE
MPVSTTAKQAVPTEHKAQQSKAKNAACSPLYPLLLTRTANKGQKRLDTPLRKRIKQSLLHIASNPEHVGEKLSMPLTGIYSHHLKYQGREYRIAYLIQMNATDESIESVVVLLIGGHENFYKRLKHVADTAQV